jgi:hypothetical protein
MLVSSGNMPAMITAHMTHFTDGNIRPLTSIRPLLLRQYFHQNKLSYTTSFVAVNPQQNIHDLAVSSKPEFCYPVMDCQLTSEIKLGVNSAEKTNWLIAKLFGKNHWCESYVASLCHVDPGFLQHVSDQTSDYLHYLCLVRMAWKYSGNDSDEKLMEYQAGLLRSSNKKSLLSALYDPFPPGLLNIFPKLGNEPLTQKDYLRLIKHLRDDNKRGFLAHIQRIKPYHLQWLDDFPTDLLHWRVLNSVTKSRNYGNLRYLIKVLERMRESGNYTETLISIRRVRTLEQLENWFRHHTQTLPFPPPPWKGNDWIIPITSVIALKQAGLKYQNCVYQYSRQVLLGYNYFYETRDGEAIVSLIKDPLLGWRIEQINGFNNKIPEQSIITKIEVAFNSADIQTEILEDREDLWDSPRGLC